MTIPSRFIEEVGPEGGGVQRGEFSFNRRIGIGGRKWVGGVYGLWFYGFNDGKLWGILLNEFSFPQRGRRVG